MAIRPAEARTPARLNIRAPLLKGAGVAACVIVVAWAAASARVDRRAEVDAGRVLPRTTLPADAPVPFVIHTVGAGETVEALAARYGVSTAAIAQNNVLPADGVLRTGDGVFVPSADGLLYTVLEAGLSADALARQLGLAPEEVEPIAGDRWGLAPGRTVLLPLDASRLASVGVALDEEARLDAAALALIARAGGPGLQLREGGLSWPAAGRLAQLFWSGHLGIDIAADAGTPIWAPANGVVSFEGWTPYGGIAICTTHDGGLESCAYHAALSSVDVGESVRRGQEIGTVGMSGLAKGPHVHWEVRLHGVTVNPLGY
jgi:murein DD-endopeptidase MepM/ murein hydrolase activator NlpD